LNGLPFSAMADSTGGGRQVDGFHGISLEYMRSPKFMIADGGYSRVAWMPSDLKEQAKEFIPVTLLDKIATELDVKTVNELQEFLRSGSHPVVERWETKEEESMSGEDEVRPAAVQVFAGGDLPITTGGFRIVLKNARIYADRVTVETIKPKNARRSE